MVPVKPELYDYQFQPNILRDTREKLGLTQAKMAELLDLPVNTLSRWESGRTAPDANSLAAIYSIAKQQNISPQFFIHKDSSYRTQLKRTRLLLAWDFQNLGLEAEYLVSKWRYMLRYLELFHPRSRANHSLRAYISPSQQAAGGVLKELKFDVYEGHFDADSQLTRDSMDECDKNPQKWVFILLADDGDYPQLLKDLQVNGVDTYLWTSEECNEKLRNAVRKENLVHWDAPRVVMTCVDVIRRLKGKQVSRSYFEQLCKEALDEGECYPDEVGFSRRNPYGSLLRWLERRGVIKVNEIAGKTDMMSIVLQGWYLN